MLKVDQATRLNQQCRLPIMQHSLTSSHSPQVEGNKARLWTGRKMVCCGWLAVLVCAGAWPMRCAGGAYSWNGGGADSHWDTLANWVGATGYPNALTDSVVYRTPGERGRRRHGGGRLRLSLEKAAMMCHIQIVYNR